MPGLIRGVARTAVVAGTATAVSGRVQRRQAEKFAERDANIYAHRQAAYQEQTQSAARPAPPQPTADIVEQLGGLAELKEQGVLTEEEFAAQTAKILGG
jgi:hypothetical protein